VDPPSAVAAPAFPSTLAAESGTPVTVPGARELQAPNTTVKRS